MQRGDAPILEFDPSPTAVIEPTEHIDPTDIPQHAVLCFFQDVIAKAVDEFDGREIDEVRSEIGLVPVYELSFEGSRLALVHPGVGAPLAAAFLEELIARGVTRVIACGGAGVLVPEIALGHVIVPTAAIRDEGTSYHYLAPSRDREDLDHRRSVSGDEREGRTARGRGLPHGRDGGRGVLRGCPVPRHHLRAAALRGRRPFGRCVGRPRMG
jgi:hypothetical protein